MKRNPRGGSSSNSPIPSPELSIIGSHSGVPVELVRVSSEIVRRRLVSLRARGAGKACADFSPPGFARSGGSWDDARVGGSALTTRGSAGVGGSW